MSRRPNNGLWLKSGKTGILIGAETVRALSLDNEGGFVALRRAEADGSLSIERLDLGSDVIGVAQIHLVSRVGWGPDRLRIQHESIPQGNYILVDGLRENWFRLRPVKK